MVLMRVLNLFLLVFFLFFNSLVLSNEKIVVKLVDKTDKKNLLVRYLRFEYIQSKAYQQVRVANLKNDNVKICENVTHQQVGRNFYALRFP